MNYRFFLFLIGCLALLPMRASAGAADLIGDPKDQKWSLYQPDNGYAALTEEAGTGGKILHIRVQKSATPFYSVGISVPIKTAINQGSRLQLRFRARSATGNPLRAVIEKNGPPYTGVAELVTTLKPEWKTFSLIGAADAYPTGVLSAKFQFGQQTGEIDLTDIRLENLGPDPHLKAAKAAIAADAMQARIEKIRMGRLKVVVHDAAGRPVPGAQITVQQTRHAFLFGGNIFSLDPLNTDDWQKQYQDRFTALFNYATVPFYWGAFEPQQGQPQYARLDAMVDWCRSHGLTPKGHPLVWQEVYPNWAPKSPDAAIPLLHQRVTDILTHYNGRIRYWDVVNEANSAAGFANGEGAWIQSEGAPKVVQTALQWARETDARLNPKDSKKNSANEDIKDNIKDNVLIYNDYNTGEQNINLLKALQRRRALPDAIGIQSHMHGGVWPLETVWERADTFAKFGRPVHFTEATVLSGPPRFNSDPSRPPSDWVTTPEDEAKQADYLEQFYTVLFSHPSVQAITYWDFSDRNAWQNAPAGLLRKDMSPKPAYTRLMGLIHGKWWTEAHGVSDRSGAFETRGFFGDYRIQVKFPDGNIVERTADLPKGSTEVIYTLSIK